MRHWRTALLAVLATGVAVGAQAAPASESLAAVKVQIKLSCLPNPATRGLSDCKVVSVTPPQFTSEVGPGAVARANAGKMPTDWQTSLAKDGLRVIVPMTVEAQPRETAAAPAAAAISPENEVVVTLSCIPNPDLTVRSCQVLSTKPETSGAATAALSAVSKGKLDANWRSIYKLDNGRVIIPVHMNKGGQ